MADKLREELDTLKGCLTDGLLDEAEYIKLREKTLESYLTLQNAPLSPIGPTAASSPFPHNLERKYKSSPLDLVATSTLPSLELDLKISKESNHSTDPEENGYISGETEPFDCSANLSQDHINQTYQSPSRIRNLEQFRSLLCFSTQNLTMKAPGSIDISSEPGSMLDLTHCEKNNDVTTRSTTSLDLSTDNKSEQKSVYELSADEFWSLILGIHIPHGEYYPLPEDIEETLRDPFPIAKELVAAILHDEKDNGFKNGAILILRAYHAKTFKDLPVSWCISKMNRSSGYKYNKAEEMRIDFYCPWPGCEVSKRWIFIDPQYIKHTMKAKRNISPINIIKKLLLERYLETNTPCPSECYLILEILGNTRTHKHIKGSKGGNRISIDEGLHNFEEIKTYLNDRAKTLSGNMMKLFAKSVAPVVAMAQCLLNQPAEAFLAGFTDVVPHKLACYQKDNTAMKQKLLKEFGINPDNTDFHSGLTKIMQHFAAVDAINRKSLQKHMDFTFHKCIIGYIQNLSFESNDNWNCICFSEAQLLSLICDLKAEPALLWDGTEPNTIKKHKALMFPLLTRPGYGWISKKTQEATTAPCKVVARMFSSDRTSAAQKHFFQVLIDKSKLYVPGGIILKDVVLVTDMDAIIDDVIKTFQMKHYWDHRHVNQALLKHFKTQVNSSVIFKKMQELRQCDTKEDAEKIIKQIKDILLIPKIGSKKEEIDNPYYDVKGWEYLSKYFLKDLDKLCHWTVKHLDSCWLWTQAIESRNNKDLNIWNSGQCNLGIEEIVVRYSEIDKAEMRQAYLHFMSAEYSTLEKALSTQRKNSQKKFMTALVRDYVDHFSPQDSKVQEMVNTLFSQTSKGSTKSEVKKEQNKKSTSPFDNKEENLETNSQQETMVSKTIRLKKLLQDEKIKQKLTEEKVPETIFEKPSKRRKKQLQIPIESTTENIMVDMIIRGEMDEATPVQTVNGITKVAEWFLWSQANLQAQKKTNLIKICRKYMMSNVASSTKSQMISFLLQKKPELLENFKKTKQSNEDQLVKKPKTRKKRKSSKSMMSSNSKKSKLNTIPISNETANLELQTPSTLPRASMEPPKPLKENSSESKPPSKRKGKQAFNKKETKAARGNLEEPHFNPTVPDSNLKVSHSNVEVEASESQKANLEVPHSNLEVPHSNLEVVPTTKNQNANLEVKPSTKDRKANLEVEPTMKRQKANLLNHHKENSEKNKSNLEVDMKTPNSQELSKIFQKNSKEAQKQQRSTQGTQFAKKKNSKQIPSFLSSIQTSVNAKTIQTQSESNKSAEAIFNPLKSITQSQMPEEIKHLKTNFRTLVTDNWINGMFAMLQEKFPHNLYVSTHAFLSTTKLKNVVSLNDRNIYFPINHNNHWALLIHFADTKQWKYYDSYANQSKQETLMFNYICQRLHKLFPKTVQLSGSIFSHQQNTWDCGYYVCIYASLLSLNSNFDLHKITLKSYFPNLRYHMIRNIWAFISKSGESVGDFHAIINEFFKNPEENFKPPPIITLSFP